MLPHHRYRWPLFRPDQLDALITIAWWVGLAALALYLGFRPW